MNQRIARQLILAVALGGLVTTALITFLIVVLLLSPDTIKRVAQYETVKLFDRELVIEGPLQLDYSMQPRITATNLSLQNADWGTAPELLAAAYISFRLDLKALFDKRLRILDLSARGVVLNLGDPVGRSPNWLLTDDTEESDWSVLLEAFEIRDSHINALIGDLAPVRVGIPRLSETTDPSGNLIVKGAGDLNGEKWQLEGAIGTLEELLVAGFVNLDMALSLRDLELSAVGSIGELATLSGTNLVLSLSGPDATFLGELFGMADDFTGDIELGARIHPENGLHGFEIRGHIARFHVDVVGRVESLATMDSWSARVETSGPDAAALGKLIQVRGFPDGEFLITGKIEVDGPALRLSDVSLDNANANLKIDVEFSDFPDSRSANGRWSLAGRDLNLSSTITGLQVLPSGPFHFAGSLGGSQDSLTADLRMGSHQLSVNGHVGSELSGTRLSVEASGDALEEILRTPDISTPLVGAYSVRAIVAVDNATVSMSELQVINGPFELTGSAKWPSINQTDTLSGQLTMNIASLAAASRLQGVPDLPDVPVTIDAKISAESGIFELTDSRVSADSLTGRVRGAIGRLGHPEDIDLTIDLRGEKLYDLYLAAAGKATVPTAFETSARLGWGQDSLVFSELEFRSPQGEAITEGHLSLTENLVGIELRISASGRDLARLLPALPGYQPPSVPFRAAAGISVPNAETLKFTGARMVLGSISLRADGTIDSGSLQAGSIHLRASGKSMAYLGEFETFDLPDTDFNIAT